MIQFFYSIPRRIISISFFLLQLIDIEAQIQEIQNKKKELAQTSSDKGVGLLESGYFDSELYDDGTNKKNRYEGYMTSIAANDDIDEDDDEGLPVQPKRVSYTAPKAVLKDIVKQVCSQMHHINHQASHKLNIDIYFLFWNRARKKTMIHLLKVAGQQLPKKKMSTVKGDDVWSFRRSVPIHLPTVCIFFRTIFATTRFS